MNFQLVAFGSALLFSASAEAATVSEGRAAYRQNKVAEAERIFAAIVADAAASPAERSDALREKARIVWLIDRNADLALQFLAAASGLGEKPCDTAELTARVLREAGRQSEVIGREAKLLGPCDDPVKRGEIQLQLLRARLDLATAAAPNERRIRLAEAAQSAAALETDAFASLDGSSARLELALLTGDAGAALEAWKDYFWLTEADAPQALSSFSPTSLFARGLQSNAAAADRLALADLLIRAGFRRQAERFADAWGLAKQAGDSPLWRRASTYLAETAKVDRVLLKANRAMARGAKPDEMMDEVGQAAQAATAAMMAAAGASGNPRQALLEHYGIVASVGKTSGYPSIHMGHVIEDRRERFVQYGQSAEVQFQAIDNMLANGFESWLWDGSAATGGWSGGGVIVHVRPEYTSGPVLAFALTSDTPTRRDLLARQERRAAQDIASVKRGSGGGLSGLGDRLQVQIAKQVENVARQKAGPNGDVRSAFLEEYWSGTLQHSIFIHEGRHEIDKAMAGDAAKLDNTMLEYHAKLSELGLADYPRMALQNIAAGAAGETEHGRANTMIVEALAAWIKAHPSQVVGYDVSLPAEVQLDKLGDGQLREIARGLDPLAREPAAAATKPD